MRLGPGNRDGVGGAALGQGLVGAFERVRGGHLAVLPLGTDAVAVLVTSGPDGKEIAARVAVALDSGIITDAVDVQSGDGAPVVSQSVFSGTWLADSAVKAGTPVM